MKSCGGRDGATRVSTSSPATARATQSASPRAAVRLRVKRTGPPAAIPRAGDLSAIAARAHHKSKASLRGGLVMKRCRGSARVTVGAAFVRPGGGSSGVHMPPPEALHKCSGSAKRVCCAAQARLASLDAFTHLLSRCLRCAHTDRVGQFPEAVPQPNPTLTYSAIVHSDEARQPTRGRYNSPLAFISLVSMRGAVCCMGAVRCRALRAMSARRRRQSSE